MGFDRPLGPSRAACAVVSILVILSGNGSLNGGVYKAWRKLIILTRMLMLSLFGWDHPCGRLKAELLEDGCLISLDDARNELFNYIEGHRGAGIITSVGCTHR